MFLNYWKNNSGWLACSSHHIIGCRQPSSHESCHVLASLMLIDVLQRAIGTCEFLGNNSTVEIDTIAADLTAALSCTLLALL